MIIGPVTLAVNVSLPPVSRASRSMGHRSGERCGLAALHAVHIGGAQRLAADPPAALLDLVDQVLTRMWR